MRKAMDADLLAKLPKWAQEYIRTVELQRDAAIAALNDFTANQEPSQTWVEEHPCTGEEGLGPQLKRSYIQQHKVTFLVGESEVEVKHGTTPGTRNVLKISCFSGQLVFMPYSSNAIEIVERK